MKKNIFKSNLIFFLILFFSSELTAQLSKWLVHETNGQLHEVDFSTPSPTVSIPSPGYGINGDEDVNLMTDINGNILFSYFCDFSGNIEVRDSNWQIMPNGTGLFGNSSSLKSCIVKIPCTTEKYYIVHIETAAGGGNLYYSILDMSANNGLGDIIQKNIFLGSNFDEGLSISHQMRNGCRWLFASKVSGNSQPVYRFLVSNSSIGSPVLVTTINYTVPASFSQDLEISPDNSKIAFSTLQTNANSPDLIVWDFDLNSGNISNRVDYYVSSQPVIGIEFSPNNLNVYWRTNMTTDNSELGRVALSNGAVNLIDNNFGRYGTAIETAGNGKLYMSHNYNINYMSEIANPNDPNIALIGFTYNAVFISSAGCRVGLPSSVDGEVPGTSIVPTFIDFSAVATNNCYEYTFIDSTCLGTWWEWNFGDSSTSNLEFPIHQYAASGIYDVTLRVLVCSDTLSLTKNGFINGSGNMNVQLTSTPSVPCFGFHTGTASVTASGHPPFQYIWTLPSGGILTTSSISHLSGGNYTLNVIDGSGCMSTQYFTINEPPPINVAVTSTNAGCGGSLGSATANPTGGTGLFSYSWNTIPIQLTPTALNLLPDTYIVTVTDSHGCTATNSAAVSGSTPVLFSISSTPATCLANDGSVTVTHTGGVGGFSYHWTPPNDTTLSTLTGLITGGYSVIATDLGTGCTQSLSTIVANSAGIGATITSSANATCETGEDGTATVAASGGQPPYNYLWPNGDTTATTNHLTPGTYLARVEDYNGCLAYASVTIGFDFPAPVIQLGPDTMPCIGTPYLMDAGSGFVSYLWSDNSTNQTLTVSSSGLYSVLVTDSNGCENSDAINVTFVVCVSHSYPHTIPLQSIVRIYPNPANDEINIYVSRIHKTEVRITMTDILGKNIFSNKVFSEFDYQKKIDVHALPVGIYLIKVEFNDEIITRRVVKQ